MAKTVSNKHGTFQYEPTQLENLVASLANQWDVALSDMAPTQSWSYGLLLERKAKREGADEVNIWYTRNPSQAFRDRASERTRETRRYGPKDYQELYADAEPRSEYAYLTKGRTRLVLEFRPDQAKLKFYDRQLNLKDVAEALDKTLQANSYSINRNTITELTFRMVPEEAKGNLRR